MNIRKEIENILCECDPDSFIPNDILDKAIDKLEFYVVGMLHNYNNDDIKDIGTELCRLNNNIEGIADKYLDEICKDLYFLANGCEGQ